MKVVVPKWSSQSHSFDDWRLRGLWKKIKAKRPPPGYCKFYLGLQVATAVAAHPKKETFIIKVLDIRRLSHLSTTWRSGDQDAQETLNMKLNFIYHFHLTPSILLQTGLVLASSSGTQASSWRVQYVSFSTFSKRWDTIVSSMLKKWGSILIRYWIILTSG